MASWLLRVQDFSFFCLNFKISRFSLEKNWQSPPNSEKKLTSLKPKKILAFSRLFLGFFSVSRFFQVVQKSRKFYEKSSKSSKSRILFLQILARSLKMTCSLKFSGFGRQSHDPLAPYARNAAMTCRRFAFSDHARSCKAIAWAGDCVERV